MVAVSAACLVAGFVFIASYSGGTYETQRPKDASRPTIHEDSPHRFTPRVPQKTEMAESNVDQLIQKAEQELKAGRTLHAAQSYQLAAELAQRRGNSGLAQSLAARAYQARKFTPLHAQ